MTDPMEALREEVHARLEADHAALVAALEAGLRRMPRSAAAWLRLAQVQLGHALEWAGADALPAALSSAQQACALAPGAAEAHALRGRCLDAMDRPAEALQAIEQACALAATQLDARTGAPAASADLPLWHTYAATLAVEQLPEAQARERVQRAAAALGIGLPSTGAARELLVAHFVHARNHHDSGLRRACDRVRQRHGGKSVAQLMAAELADTQRALRQQVRRADVPAPLRPLVSWAQRLGVGDDGLRGLALEQASDAELARLAAEMDPRAAAIDAWLAPQDAATLPPAASAFARLVQALEEARAMGRCAPPSLPAAAPPAAGAPA